MQSGLHQSPVVATLVFSREVVGNQGDKGQIEQRVKALTGRSDVEVLAVRPILDSSGQTQAFEVDIR